MPLTEADRNLLERYLDGDIAGESLSIFERRLQSESDLQHELALQQAISLSLRRSLAPRKLTAPQVLGADRPMTPNDFSTPQFAEPLPESHAVAGRIHQSRPWLRRVAIAAVLIGGLYGAWIVWPLINPPSEPTVQPTSPRMLTAAAAYDAEVKSGFEPDWVCANDEEFIRTFHDRLGQGLIMKPSTERAHMLGLDYAKVLSPLTVTMLGEVDRQPVLVIIDRTSLDNPQAINADLGDLHAFRREIGSLVLYEITPLDQPQMLDLIDKAGE